MDKPDWSEAPEWARYLAQDKDSEWYWFESEPKLCGEVWELSKYVGKSERARKEAWTISLEPRP